MKRSFILVGMVAVLMYFNLFAEGFPKGAHTCLEYAKVMFPNYKTNPYDVNEDIVWNDPNLSAHSQFNTQFIPYWFDNLEFADNASNYSEEFLKEHGGRAGKIIFQVQDERYPNYNGKHYPGCSGMLIGKNYFITAGHCAVANVEREFPTEDGGSIILDANVKNVGVLFGYQMEDRGGNNNFTGFPRVSLNGYLKNNANYLLYTDPGSEYSDFTKHPAYFPIIDDESCNNDGSVENGWGNVWGVNENGEAIIRFASDIKWSDSNSAEEKIGEIDYAIYQLGINSNEKLPFKDYDPWPWLSPNNTSFQNPLLPTLNLPWALPDNTNGFRGWARVNTAVLPAESSLNIIGSPGVSSFNDYKGLKVVNGGYVVDGQSRGLAYKDDHEEDILIFEDADIQIGHSGSPIIDDSGKVAGVAVWMDCAPGGRNTWKTIMDNIKNNYEALIRPAQNYATPMWKICRASQIIKDAARDQDCNGQNDWWDFIEKILSRFATIDLLEINESLLNNLTPSSSTTEIQNYRYDARQQRVITETKEIPAYTYQVAFQNNGNLFYIAKQNNVFYLFKNGTSLGAISNYPEMSGSSAFVKGNDIYFAGGNLSIPTPMLPGSGNNSFQPYITKISSDGQNGYNFSVVAVFPTSLEDIRIFELGNDIYVSGNTATNFVVYKLVADNQSEFGYSLSLVSDTTQPVRKDYNLTAADGKIIVSGGATDYISTVLNLDEAQYPSTFAVYNNIIMLEPDVSNNWITVAENINDKIIMLSVTAIDDGNLVLVNPFITVGNSMQKFVIDLDNIPVSGENLRVSFESHPLVFCLNESENTVSGGLTISGECVPFTHPWYNSFSAGATVYSLDGKGDRLYVGTNNAIKVYDISDPTSPVLVSSFSTSSRVNDIEVYGNSLFAATNGGLYKLDASDPDELTQILFISTVLNYQYKVEVDSGKLYVGEDNGIKVRDLETLSVLTSVNNGSVLDFAIENGEIGLYKDALFSPVEIRDAETLTLKANEFFGCFEIEVGSSGGKFYLSCDDEIYKFEDDGDGGISFTELSGDIRELQDVYTFDGYTYFYDENTIWISTSSDVPAICGNGIVEGDEVCDGGQINCEELDSNYVSGTATCNSTCDGYNTNNCSDDGW